MAGQTVTAQQQTPENAQRFLSLIVGQGTTEVSDNINTRKEAKEGRICDGERGKYTCYHVRQMTKKVTAVAFSGKCVMTFRGTFAPSDEMYGVLYAENPGQDVTIDVSKVSAIEVPDGSTWVRFAGVDAMVSGATPEVAKRLGVAFGVMRDACDPTKNTGF